MIIYTNILSRVFKKSLNILFLIIVPIIMISAAMFMSTERGFLRVGIADYDKTLLTLELKNSLKDKCQFYELEETDIQKQLINQKVDYAIAIDKGFTQDLIDGKDVQIKGYGIRETDTSFPVKMSIDSFINAAKSISKQVMGSNLKFYAGLEQYKNGSYTVEYKTIEEGSDRKGNTLTSLGFLIMNMLYLSTFASAMIIEDKEKRVFYRIFTGPMALKSYMLQSILSFLTLMLIQVAAIFAIMVFGFKADFGPSTLNVFLVMAVFAVVCVAFGLAINSIAKDTRQAGLITTLLVTPICMLGGCFWPRDFMPDILQKIANFVPATWALKAAERMLYGDTILSIYLELTALIMFSVVFFLLGSWRKADVAK